MAVAAEADSFGSRANMSQQFGTGEVVVEDDVGRAEAFGAAEGQQPGIPGAGADEVHSAVWISHVLSSELSCSP